MAKFTVFFRDKPILSKIFETGVVHIGRDDTNDITVDNLAVAPVHAVAVIRDNGTLIKQLNDDFPLIVNGEKTKEAVLQHGDKITLGKHDIIFQTTEKVMPIHPSTEPGAPSEHTEDEDDFHPEFARTSGLIAEANLQVMDGKNIGRLIPLRKAMTRLGHTGNGVVIITRRKDGYFISALETHSSLMVNNRPLNDRIVKLQNNDTLVIDNTALMFFQNS